eukprot:TRINITY_DN11062_c0_g1_i1.p1 TRINITY_DN11062_c0_g1~~TRINITY_DN11062_c0_g1_i1.p1  ORF type:complete len:287 (+),score=66.75 TRINITY_DN11062_c0_g1_i1:57-917(+)
MEGFTEKDQERIYNEAKEAAQVGKSHRGLGYHPEQDHVETKFKHASHADYQHDAFTEKDQMRIYKEAKIAAKDADQHLGLGYHHHHISKKLDHQGAYVHDDHGFTEDDQARIYKEISDAAEQNRNHRGIGYTAEKEKFEAKFVHSSDSKDERESQHKDPKAIASSIAAKLKKPKGETSTSGIANKRSGEEEKSHSHHKKHHHDHQSEHRNERRSDGKVQSATSWMREDLNHSGTLEFQSLDEGIYQMEAGHRKDLQKLIEDEEVENLAEKDTGKLYTLIKRSKVFL